MKPIWGQVNQLDAQTWELVAPRDTPDGIGSALAVIGTVSQIVGQPLRVSWDEVEHWGGEEQWRSFWLMFPVNQRDVWPVFYVRPSLQAIEVGWVMTKEPTSQVILESIKLPPSCVFVERVSLLVEGERLTLGVDVIASDLQRKTKIYSPLGPMALRFTLKGIEIPGFQIEWPPLVAAYCEASRVRVRVS